MTDEEKTKCLEIFSHEIAKMAYATMLIIDAPNFINTNGDFEIKNNVYQLNVSFKKLNGKT